MTTHRPPPRVAKRTAAPARRRSSGLSRTGKTRSRAQQRLLFARMGDAAKRFTTRGRYKRLPERRTAAR